jgi:hypothetical protein
VRLLDFVIVIAILVAVVAAPFLLIGWSNYLSRRPEERVFPTKSVLFFVLPLLIGALAYGSSTLIAECQVAEFLDSVSSHSTVSIDGRIVQNRQEVLETLRGFQHLPAHHSSPGRIIQIDISEPPRNLRIWLARDSSDPHEYWVLVPSPSKLAFRASLKKDIGHIKTPLFDGY